MKRSSLARPWAFAFLGLFLWAWTGCATNPVTGQKELSFISESQEIQMGAEADKQAQEQYGLYEDPAVSARIDRIGQQLAKVSDRPNLEWHFRVLDSPIVNAFALPGGYIFITRGILASLNSDAQLAGVLGHEIGHVTARHSVRQATRAQLANLGLGLGMIFLRGSEQFGGLAQSGLGLLFLKFSRANETQADELGVKYATAAGYDPREIPNTYTMLKKLAEESGARTPAFLSTHPDPGNRETRTSQLAQTAVANAKGRTLVVQAPDFKRSLDGLVYGNDPRQGYLVGSRFYHPQLRFQMEFPSGWQVENGHSAVTATTSGGQAGMQLSMVSGQSSGSPEDYVVSLRRGGQISDAQGRSETIGGYPAWVGEVSAPNGQGGTQVMEAAWIRRDGTSLYQFLGAPNSVRDAFTASVRSYRDLTDASRINVVPDRIKIVSAPGSESVVAIARGTPGLAVNETKVAWLNGFDAGATPSRGTLLKLPLRGR